MILSTAHHIAFAILSILMITGTPACVASQSTQSPGLTSRVAAENEAVQIDVLAKSEVKLFRVRPVGINMDYLMDSDRRRPDVVRTTQDAIAEMRPGFLRFPEGEQGDNYLWSVPPFEHLQPRLARVGTHEWPSNDRRFIESDGINFKSRPLDFDEFITIARAAGAEPVVIVCYDSMYATKWPGTTVVPTREQLLTTATEWVRYANKVKGYNVRYWEIGNETENLSKKNGGVPSANQYAIDVGEFSRAMKGIDPTIKVGASGKTENWFRRLLSATASDIDFIVPHAYPVFNWSRGYDDYLDATPEQLAQNIKPALRALASTTAEDQERIEIAVTETNVIDYGDNGWTNSNDLGHAVAAFDLIGQLLLQPHTSMMLLWNTRWINNDAPGPLYVGDALTPDNEFSATGRAASIWSQNLGTTMVKTLSPTHLRVFSSRSKLSSDETLQIFLVNPTRQAVTGKLVLHQWILDGKIDRWVFHGTGADDLAPKWDQEPPPLVTGSVATVRLEPISITVMTLPGRLLQ